MKSSVLEEIRSLRTNKLKIDYNNSNRYCLIAKEDDGTETAYCFSTPIYNINSRSLINLRFIESNDGICFTGSNSQIKINNEIFLKNTYGAIKISTNNSVHKLINNAVVSSSYTLTPTLNGVLFKTNDRKFTIRVESSEPFMKIRSNSKYLAYMKEKFEPLMTLSAIGTADRYGSIYAPAIVSYKKINDKECEITITSSTLTDSQIMFEVNMYEQKLFQDTTVESRNPKENNSYGGIAFIGNSEAFGEQWLYSRIDLSKIHQIVEKKAKLVKLHIPIYNNSSVNLTSHRTATRFCSFGSNWNTKIGLSRIISNTQKKGNYQTLNLTQSLINPKNGNIKATEGFILRTQEKGGLFVPLATGDCYFSPQILEINYINEKEG